MFTKKSNFLTLLLALGLLAFTACNKEEQTSSILPEATEATEATEANNIKGSEDLSDLELGSVEQLIKDEPRLYAQLMADTQISEESKHQLLQYEAASRTQTHQIIFNEIEGQYEVEEPHYDPDTQNKFYQYLLLLEGVTQKEHEAFVQIKTETDTADSRSCYWRYYTDTSDCKWIFGCWLFHSSPCGRNVFGAAYEYCNGYPTGRTHAVNDNYCNGCSC